MLSCLDGYMNVRDAPCSVPSSSRTQLTQIAQIAMEETEELVNGVVKNAFGDAFIRGNNGMSSVRLRSLTAAVLYIARL